MQSFKQFLDEARRNPELNPKISIYKALEPYKDRDDMYITYTADVGKDFSKKSFKDKDKRPRGKGISSLDRNISGFKVGINPQSDYNTPNGIYVYPLKQAWRLYANAAQQRLDVPFAGDEPTVALLKSKGNLRILELSDYSSKDFDRDYPKIGKIVTEFCQKNLKVSEAFGWEIAKGTIESAIKDSWNQTPGGQFWNMTRYTHFMIQNFRRKQQIFSISVLPQYKDNFANFSKPDAKANFGDMVVRVDIKLTGSTNTKSSITWTKLLIDLGYGAITDKKGQGIIHRAEQMQGVFLSPNSYEVVGSFYNKHYKDDPFILMTKEIEKTHKYQHVKFDILSSKPMEGSMMTSTDFIKTLFKHALGLSSQEAMTAWAMFRFATKQQKSPLVVKKNEAWYAVETLYGRDAEPPYKFTDKNGIEIDPDYAKYKLGPTSNWSFEFSKGTSTQAFIMIDRDGLRFVETNEGPQFMAWNKMKTDVIKMKDWFVN